MVRLPSGAILQAALVLLPFTRGIFGLYMLTPAMWGIVLGLGVSTVVIMEIAKLVGCLVRKEKGSEEVV